MKDKVKAQNEYLHKEIYKYLNHISNSIGEILTEYDWREVCGLMKMMEDKNMVERPLPPCPSGELDCPFNFTSRCTMGRCDCKPKSIEKW